MISSPSHRPGRADALQRNARRQFYLLLLPVFLRVLWLHWFESHDRQFTRLGRHSKRREPHLPLEWARWLANRVCNILGHVPILRRRPCYWRSMVIYDLLPRFGFSAELHLGASFPDGKTSPHMWVSSGGIVLVDPAVSAGDYAEVAVYTSEPARSNPAQ